MSMTKTLYIPLKNRVYQIELKEFQHNSYLIRTKDGNLTMVNAVKKWLKENINLTEFNYMSNQLKNVEYHLSKITKFYHS